MRILFIGSFSPLCEEENLHNFTLLNRLRNEGNECRVINISASLSKDSGTVNIKGYFDFAIKLLRLSRRSDVIHFLTKGYVRPGLMKLITAVILGKLMRCRIIITLHAELFSVFGRLRSRMGGQQLLHLSFSLADSIICGDRHTYEVALSHHKTKDKFHMIPSIIGIPEDINEKDIRLLKKLENKKRVILFSNVSYPSLLFDVLNVMLSEYLDTDTGVAVCLINEKSQKLEKVAAETAGRLADNIVSIEPDNVHILSAVYGMADVILRPLSCEALTLFKDIALSVKKPARAGTDIFFPVSLTLIKEGEVTDICVNVMKVIINAADKKPVGSTEDFYSKIRKLYSKDS